MDEDLEGLRAGGEGLMLDFKQQHEPQNGIAEQMAALPVISSSWAMIEAVEVLNCWASCAYRQPMRRDTAPQYLTRFAGLQLAEAV
jgi:hypothetical protein